MRAYLIRPLPEHMVRSVDQERRNLPAAFALLEAELAVHALPVAHAPRLAETSEEKESAEAA